MLYNHHKNYIFSVLTVLALIFLFVLPAYAGNINQAYRLNEDGLSALNKSDYELAIRYFNLALKEAPGNDAIVRNLATAYNNYGLSLAKEGDLDKAIECLRLALSLQPATPLYRENLSGLMTEKAYNCYQNKKIEESEKLLKEALEYNSNNFNALSLAGDISYYNQSLQEAKSYWERALGLKPDSESVKERLFKLSKEYPIEKGLKELDSFNFEIRYAHQDESRYEDKAYWVRECLLDAYREVGIDFNYYPKYKIIVLIYSEEDFKNLKDKSPSGTVGIYDGKIRLSIKKDIIEEELKRLIFHEYTHLVVNDLSSGNCPVWLNEGLARYEESKVGEVKFLYLKDRVIPLSLLSEAFESPNEKDVLLAYEESVAIVNYIVDRFNLYTVTKILEKLKQERFEDVLQKELYLNLDELEERWKEENDLF